MWIETLPVYSRFSETEEVPAAIRDRLPQGLRLYRHQAATFRALTEGGTDVIFNTALTGDGKSLAGQLPALVRGWQWGTLAMYPTNELVRDQEAQLRRAAEQWRPDLRWGELYGARLDEIMAGGDYARRGDALLSFLRNHDVVLTNPDILHYIMHQFYLYPDDAPDRLIGPLLQRTAQLTFDEFHIFQVPQVISVLNALLFMHEVGGAAAPRWLFLSATPGDLLLEYLQRAGLRVTEIRGEYHHGAPPAATAEWRQIMQPARLYLDTLRAEEWIEAHLHDTLLPFFLERGPGAKGAIIVNSLATAYRLLQRVQPVFAAQGLRVMANTGLSSRTERSRAYDADLLIGTSTVDVGIDFRINWLLFESRDAGSFLQRLGRLGRHAAYERDGQEHRFCEHVAYALVPTWVREALLLGRDGAPPLLAEGEPVNRQALAEVVQEAYPPTATFAGYARLWGELQTVRILCGLSRKTVREQYAQTRAALEERYASTFNIRLRAAYGRYRSLYNNARKLLDEAATFRGGDYTLCGLIDETEPEPGDRCKAADVLPLLTNAELVPLEEEEYRRHLARMGCAGRAADCEQFVAFYLLKGWLAERRPLRFFVDHDLRLWQGERWGQAQLLNGLQLDGGAPGLGALNRRLRRRTLPVLLVAGRSPLELQRRLRLPLLFALYGFVSRDGVEGTLALGREALLLEVRLRETRLDAGGGAIVL
ncbi:MAG: type I-D CRISPR-associated helicase Cas3' [Anaerolineae bacterium]